MRIFPSMALICLLTTYWKNDLRDAKSRVGINRESLRRLGLNPIMIIFSIWWTFKYNICIQLLFHIDNLEL